MGQQPPQHPLRRLFANPAFLRLWAVGGLANAMRWVDILVGAVFTFEVTRSALAVALVALVRALPMLFAGALAGAVAEVLDRRRLLMAGQALTAAGAFIIMALALAGRLEVWHLGANGLLAGLVWTGEMASRRRMVTEAAGERDVVQAVALDSLTTNTTRMAGPLIGGLVYETLGLAAAYALAGSCYLLALLLLAGLRHSQPPGRLHVRKVAADIADAIRVVRRMPVLQVVILVTIAMNVFGFCVTTVLPALGSAAYGATPLQVGLLTAAEPAGALLTGLFLASRRGVPLLPGLMVAGGGFTMLCLVLLPLMPTLWLAAGMLMLGGIGTALFSALQTALPVTRAPPEARSRVLGLVTTCIGMGPAGVLAIGVLADAIGPGRAIPIMAACGGALLLATWLTVLRRH
ncbi:MFS transporter [Siccirubricoccus sp. G192]|uniref:MFS transporter n=1 Tax=Siccirubricoccus sp. G192 TaxID=2849651 RepID=UPI001C2C6C68|nr:MFS transporter [Siccirubricoccus sp. G192]MBV1798664.1 MFS transporter [Siccirubricoccus sp. G192]